MIKYHRTLFYKRLCDIDEDVVCGIVYIPPEYTVYSSVDAFSELENEYLALQRNYKYIFQMGILIAEQRKTLISSILKTIMII